ncbi:MAG: hypothetical protein AAB250_13480 [Bdellovibrionota bacterium]
MLFSSWAAQAQCPGSPPAGIDCVENGAGKEITAFSVCGSITNSHASGKALMVPIGSSTEWSTFRTNLAPGVTNGSCGGGPPLPALVQTAAPVYAAAGTLHTVTLSSAPTVGNVVVMLTAGRASTHVVNSVDGCGATWTKMVNRSCTNSAAEVWAGACTNTGTTITIVSNTALARVNTAQEWTNLTPLANGTNTAYISGSWTNSISIATTQAPSVVFVANGMDKVATDDTGTNSFLGAGFTGGGSNPTFTGGSFGYYIAASTGTYSTTWTAGSGGASPNNCIAGANVY